MSDLYNILADISEVQVKVLKIRKAIDVKDSQTSARQRDNLNKVYEYLNSIRLFIKESI